MKIIILIMMCCLSLSCDSNEISRQDRVERALVSRGVVITPDISKDISVRLRSIATFDPAEDQKIKRIVEEFTPTHTITVPLKSNSIGPNNKSKATIKGDSNE